MTMSSDEMRAMIASVSEEEQAHLSAARGANTMPTLLTEVDRHTQTMEAILHDMGAHMAGMSHCADANGMMGLREDMRSELQAHATTMHAMTDVAQARAEAEDHVVTMGLMRDDMNAVLERSHCGGP